MIELSFRDKFKGIGKWLVDAILVTIVSIFVTRYWDALEKFVREPRNNLSSGIALFIILSACGVTAFTVYLIMKRKVRKDKKQSLNPVDPRSSVMPTANMTWTEDMARDLDPKLSHVYAVFFYPPSVSWQAGQRDPQKEMPRLKAIVNTKTKKAYWMTQYALDLFRNRRIQNTTAEAVKEQDMRDYFVLHDIDLIEKPASEDDLLDGINNKVVFQANIVDKKPQYKLGDYVYFRTYYKGDLVNGFFDNEIYAPQDTTFPNGKDHTWRWPMDTLESTPENDEITQKCGKLNGKVDHESKWHFIIERNYPKGVWYSAIEERMFDTFRFVACDRGNAHSFSYEYSSIIRDAGSVFGTIMDVFVRKTADAQREKYDMRDYKKWLVTNVPDISKLSLELTINRTNRYLIPFYELQESNSGLAWWDAFNKMKHSDMESFSQGNLMNAINGMACLAGLHSLMHYGNPADDIDLFDNFGYREPKEELEKMLFLTTNL